MNPECCGQNKRFRDIGCHWDCRFPLRVLSSFYYLFWGSPVSICDIHLKLSSSQNLLLTTAAKGPPGHSTCPVFSPHAPAPAFMALSSNSGSSSLAAGSVRNFDLVPEPFRDVVFRMVEHIEEHDISTLQAVEVFSGVGNMAAAFNAFGLPASTFEKEHGGESEDVLSDAGLGKLLFTVARVATGGLVWLGPPCSSWIWLSRRSTKRKKSDVQGDATVASVAEANKLAHVVADVIRTCHALGVYFVVEQPNTSLLFDYEPMALALSETRARRAFVELGRAGARTAKPLCLVGTAPYLARLAAIAKRRPMVTPGRALTTRKGGWVNGEREALQQSSSYPRTFCCLVARQHADLIGHVIPDHGEREPVLVEVDSD